MKYQPPSRAFTKIPNLVIRSSDLSATERSVLLYLLHFAGLAKIHPSQARIASELGLSKNSVIKSLRSLENLNVIRRRRNGRNRSNEYFIQDVSSWKIRSSVVHKANLCDSDTASPVVQNLHPNKPNNKNKELGSGLELSEEPPSSIANLIKSNQDNALIRATFKQTGENHDAK